MIAHASSALTVGIHKGGVDYDDINARMAPDNRALAELTVKQLENWDPGYSPFNGLNSG
jgi:hypothetical protein